MTIAQKKEHLTKLLLQCNTNTDYFIYSANKGVDAVYSVAYKIDGALQTFSFMPYKEMVAYLRGYADAINRPLFNKEAHTIEEPLLQDSTDIELIRFDLSQIWTYIIMSAEEFCNAAEYNYDDVLNFFGDNNGDFIATKTFTLPFFVCEFEGYQYFVHMGNDTDTNQILSAFENGESQEETDFSVNVFDGMKCNYDTYFLNI